MKEQKTRIVKLHCTREQIYIHKCYVVLEVPADAAEGDLRHLDNYELIGLPWHPLSEPEYDGEQTDEDRLIVETIENVPNGTHPADGLVVRDNDGDLVCKREE